MKVTIFGPNLSGRGQAKGQLHVHEASCSDCGKYGPGRLMGGDDQGWTIDATSQAEVVMDVYPPGDFVYDAADWRDYNDLWFAPCVDLPEEATP